MSEGTNLSTSSNRSKFILVNLKRLLKLLMDLSKILEVQPSNIVLEKSQIKTPNEDQFVPKEEKTPTINDFNLCKTNKLQLNFVNSSDTIKYF